MIGKYILKSKDVPLVYFDFETNSKIINGIATPIYSLNVTYVNETERHLFPKNLEKVNNDSVLDWINSRKAPKNRCFVERILASYKDNSNPMGYVDISRALSVNDAFWIDNELFQNKWSEVNLFDHPFDEILSYVAFTGHSHKVSGVITTPELTTNGMQKKAWSNRNNGIYLIKGASDLLDRDGRSEVYSEYYASQIAKVMGVSYVPYDIEEYHHKNGKKELISVCKAFTEENIGYVPICYILENRNIKFNRMLDNYEVQLQIGNVYGSMAFEDMMLFDSIIYNTDRHLKNFGMLVDNTDGHIVGAAPLFDHGMSLLVGAAKNDLLSVSAMKEYQNNLYSKFDISFDEQAYRYVQKRHIPFLKKLCSFQLMPHPDYYYNRDYLQKLNKMLQDRGRRIIAMYKDKISNPKRRKWHK